MLPKIEAIHIGRTKNFVHYTSDKLRGDASLKSGVYSWVDPYAKPVIYNHDVHTEATGRVLRAAYSDYTQAGRPGIIVVPKITDPKAIKAIQDGRLLTVSIGADTDAAICSVCGTDIANEGYCGHMKGEEYDGQVAEWITGNIWFEELSWVNVPADEDAMIVEGEANMLVPTEEMNEADKAGDINAFYKVPKGVSIIEAVSSESDAINKGGEDMPDKAETVITENETPEVVTPEAAVEPEVMETPEQPEEDATSEGEEKPEAVTPEEEVKPEDDDNPEKAKDEVKPEGVVEENSEPGSIEANAINVTETPVSKELDEAKALNVALEAQVTSLSEELKSFYKQAILEKIELDDEMKPKFTERLDARSLSSLKEYLEDINSGFFVQPVKKEDKRKVEKVASPIKESKEEKPETKTKKSRHGSNALQYA